jgi:hypothetical protein
MSGAVRGAITGLWPRAIVDTIWELALDVSIILGAIVVTLLVVVGVIAWIVRLLLT